MLESLLNDLANTSWLEAVAVLFGIAYIVLAARENILCWYAAFINTGLSVILFWQVLLPMESALNAYYLAMAIYGWWQWRFGNNSDGAENSGVMICRWALKNHLLAIAAIIGLTLISGTLLAKNTDAALPYVDSFTTWSAVITTWMVAKKILENWLYWIVIDAVSVWLYFERGLILYGALFITYTVIAVYGYLHWRQQLPTQTLSLNKR